MEKIYRVTIMNIYGRASHTDCPNRETAKHLLNDALHSDQIAYVSIVLLIDQVSQAHCFYEGVAYEIFIDNI